MGQGATAAVGVEDGSRGVHDEAVAADSVVHAGLCQQISQPAPILTAQLQNTRNKVNIKDKIMALHDLLIAIYISFFYLVLIHVYRMVNREITDSMNSAKHCHAISNKE